MGNINFDEAIKSFKDIGIKIEPDKIIFGVPDARTLLAEGIKHFVQNPKWMNEYENIAEWLSNNQGRGLMLYGMCGLGKTVICSRVIPLLLNTYCRLLSTIINAQQMNERVDQLLEKGILVIDDVGTEDIAVSYGNKRVAFAELVDNAEKKGKILIITTNLSAEELKNKYGERVIDRLRAITKIINIKGKSLRK